MATVKTDENSRFIVKLPFKDNLSSPILGDSRKKAIATQLSLEKRFKKDHTYRKEYMAQIEEGIRLGISKR